MKYDDNGVWKTLNIKVTDTLPVGTIIPYAGTTIPSNYMKCEGQELSRIEYDILFNAIGTTYGVGDGTTTFNLPNLKGRVITGIDSNDTDFDTLGETGGEKVHTLTVDEMPSHAHEQLAVTNPNSGGSGIRGTYNGQEGDGMSRYPTNAQTGTTGGGEPHNNLQPYIVLNYIIKVLDAPAIQAQVVNGYSTSSRDSYSCNYVNNKVKKIYSADEKVVGKFFGKPLYSKTIINHPLTSGEQVFVDTGLQVSSIEHIFFDKSASFLIRNNGAVQCGIGTTSGYNFDTRYFSKDDGVANWQARLYIGESIYQDSTVYVTICYTKTTD